MKFKISGTCARCNLTMTRYSNRAAVIDCKCRDCGLPTILDTIQPNLKETNEEKPL